ncbi:MAG: eukaryotic translation initiation factor subunit eIF2B [Lasallia pustulata]|uniref:Translation initiation factor eIF2B subunit gamma n=1 Tax=Lasallia pustulata TaxID=136370 RepID=A0A5M8PC10_9LECA|nr:MAG: eukaryotic translation initiation factor subunit eIF2B [Lasallia pustulata]
MPHAQPMPPTGFQALILCGPGVSLNTFTSSPEEFPKALIPIANRPMIWYPLDWCYRMGITNIHLVTPPSSAKAIEAALSQNPHLTSLPLPTADILAPEALSQNTPTAGILRLPEVQAAITGDFLVLPCDLMCEIAGESLLEAWMIQEAGLGGAAAGIQDYLGPKMGLGGERGGRRGGMGVWFQTKGEGSVKGEETDFVATTVLHSHIRPSLTPPEGSLRSHIANLVYATPTDTLNDITEDKKGFPIRHGLIRKHGRIRMLTTHRDAHIYIFPHWVLEMISRNERLDSISEDVVGMWAKAGWQDGLGDKLGLREIFSVAEEKEGENGSHSSGSVEDDLDLGSMTTTGTSDLKNGANDASLTGFATRVGNSSMQQPSSSSKLTVPPMLAYIHPLDPAAPLIRRVDTAALLLSVSLRLAKLGSIDEVGKPASSPFAHAHKIAHPSGIAQRCTVTKNDCLLAENVSVEEKCVVKESVIGASCTIKTGARLTRCVLMDGVVVGERCQLTGCILGRRSGVGQGCVLKECEVQEGYGVVEETDARGEKFMVFEGLEDGEGNGGPGMEGNEAGYASL